MPRIPWFAAIIALAALATAFQLSSQSPPAQEQTPNPDKPLQAAHTNGSPDAHAQMAMPDQQAKNQNPQAANIDRKRQITDDSARLLKLASDLKAEVDKTSKDTLSLGVIRKAEEIEKLAHNVREEMKETMAAN
jgi:hypothetical protein